MAIQRKDPTVDTTTTRPTKVSVLSKIGLLAVVMAIVWGIFEMHVIGGFSAAVMESAPMASTTKTMHTAASSHAFPEGQTVPGPAMAKIQGAPAPCGASPFDEGTSMAGHDTCVPSSGPDLPSVSLPGTIPWLHMVTAFTHAPGPKSKGRVPDPPSFIQLSIIRT